MMPSLCERITNHRWRKFIGETEHNEHCPPDCRTEYYYRCRICGTWIWNYKEETK